MKSALPLTDVATSEVAALLKSYSCHSTMGDKYGAQWVVAAFQKCRIKYEHSERDRSAIYLDCLPLFTTGRARLIDSKRLVHQLALLERRTSSVGKDRVDHGPEAATTAPTALQARWCWRQAASVWLSPTPCSPRRAGRRCIRGNFPIALSWARPSPSMKCFF